MLNISDIVYDEFGDVLDSMIEIGGMSKEEYQANLDINHDLYASAIRKNQDHPIFMALEVSVCEPQNYV